MEKVTKRFRVVLSWTVEVEAHGEGEAVKSAYRLLDEELKGNPLDVVFRHSVKEVEE